MESYVWPFKIINSKFWISEDFFFFYKIFGMFFFLSWSLKRLLIMDGIMIEDPQAAFTEGSRLAISKTHRPFLVFWMICEFATYMYIHV
jgi:hypothetical protein